MERPTSAKDKCIGSRKRRLAICPALVASVAVHAAAVFVIGSATFFGRGVPARVDIQVTLADAGPREPVVWPDVLSFSPPPPKPVVPEVLPAEAARPDVALPTPIVSASEVAPPSPMPKSSVPDKPNPALTRSSAPSGKTSGVAAGKGAEGGREARPLASRNAPPRYPDFARRQGWQGVVLVRVVVRPDGKVKAASLFRGSGYSVLDQAALEAVRRWLFQPKISGGLAVESTIEVPVTFSLRKA